MLRLSLAMRAVSFKHFLSALFVLFTSAQLLGQPLVSTQWYRIRAPHVDIIFRGNINREAQRIANTLEHLYEPINQSLGITPPKISVILRNQKAYSNGCVALMPRRVEMHTFPSQDYNFSGTNDWLSLLSVHEFRHVVQYAKLTKNFNRLAHRLGGDIFLGGIIGLNIPIWFLEGDTVSTETVLTQSGRGHIPDFSLLYRTNLLTKKSLSYYKQLFGSFKDLMPGVYPLGYHLMIYLRSKYGTAVLSDILQRTTWPRPFLGTVKKVTGKSLAQIYEDTNQAFTTLWQEQQSGLQLTQATRLNARANTDCIGYACPQLDPWGNIVVLKSGMGTVAQFVRLGGQRKEDTLCIPGHIKKETGFSMAQNKIIWVETIPDPVWAACSYGVIKSYDTQTKRLKTLTYKSRYGSAALSPDATKIVAFESDEGYNHRLVIIDAENGQVLQRLPNPDNHFYLTPKWSEDGKQIVVVKNVQRSVTIALIDVVTGATQDLLPYSTAHIGCPVIKGEHVFYNSGYSGIDNIYAIDLATYQRYQVTSRKYGAYNPIISADGCWLIFNDFTRDGMDVAKMPLNPKQWIPLEQVEDRSVHYYAPLVKQENNGDVLANVPNHTYAVERYHPWKHWLNVHSWLTITQVLWDTEDPKKPLVRPKRVNIKVLQSKDLLDTTTLEVDYLHDFKKKVGKAVAEIIYTGWYPITSLKVALEGNYQGKMTCGRMLGLKLARPWTLQYGQYTYQPSLSTESTLYNNAHTTYYTQDYVGSFARTSQKSLRDINYPWAQIVTINHMHTPYGENNLYLASSTHLHAKLSFPGLARHHSLQLFGGYQYKKSIFNETSPRNDLRALSPGKKLVLSAMEKIPYAGVRYALPLCYPDYSVGYLLYLKRIRAEASYRVQCASIVRDTVSPFPNKTYRKIGHSERIKEAPQYKNTIALSVLVDCYLFPWLNLPLLSLGVQYNYDIGKHHGNPQFINFTEKHHGNTFSFVLSMTPNLHLEK